MKAGELLRELENGKIAPVYLLYGEEPYYIDQIVKRIQKFVVDTATADFNFDYFYGEEADGDLVVQAASSFPMMADRRLVIVKHVQKLSTTGKKSLLKYIESPMDTTCLILTAQKIDKRQKFYSNLIKMCSVMESKSLYDNQAREWLLKHLKARGLQISMQAVQLLVQKSGTSMWALRTEADKLMAAAGDNKQMSDGEVAELAGYSRSYTIWELTDCVGKKDLSGATDILNHMMAEGQSGIGLLMNLYRRFSLLLRIRSMMDKGHSDSTIMTQLKLNYYFGKLYFEQTRKYSSNELLQGLDKLAVADVYLKTGRMNDKIALPLLIHELIRGGNRRQRENIFC
ncbi:DNA polymerase III subunit delta [bacterium]|nr:DNA polymerase III subunit delta [bacterium]